MARRLEVPAAMEMQAQGKQPEPVKRPETLEEHDYMPPEPDDWHLFEPPMDEEFMAPNDFQVPGNAASVNSNIAEPPRRAYGLGNGDHSIMKSQPATVQSQPAAERPQPAAVESQPAANSKPAAILPSTQTDRDTKRQHVSVPFFVPPTTKSGASATLAQENLLGNDETPRMVSVILRSSGDKVRDVRRLKRIHGILLSFPGKDKFSFLVFEEGRRFLMEFPNDTTGICSELLRKLIELAGEGNVNIEPIKIQ